MVLLQNQFILDH